MLVVCFKNSYIGVQKKKKPHIIHSGNIKVLKATEFQFKETAGNDINEWSR